MIKSFANQGTEDIFRGEDSKAARKVCAPPVWATARRKLDQLNLARRIVDLRNPPANRLEKLPMYGDGFWGIRVSDKYRVVFRWDGEDASEVQVVDYH